MLDFKIIAKDGKARTGILKLNNGVVKTPAFLPVGTKATVKTLAPWELEEIGVQIIVNNTYHLHFSPGEELIQKAGGVHKFMNWNKPILTDSGGFQAYSLGFGSEMGASKFLYDKIKIKDNKIIYEKSNGVYKENIKIKTKEENSNKSNDVNKKDINSKVDEKDEVKSSNEMKSNNTYKSNKRSKSEQSSHARMREDGVIFKSIYNGKKEILTPEKSIQIQQKLGADIILALDECTPPNSDYEYTKNSLERTNQWAIRSIKAKTSDQALYGIIQGGLFRDLRVKSTQFISKLTKGNHTLKEYGLPSNVGFDGIAIGGAFGRNEMYKTLDWITENLPEEVPIHLLGIGTVEDIFESVMRGIDTFDCVGPTRIARVGYAYVNPPLGNRKNKFRIRLTRAEYRDDFSPIDSNCGCKMCSSFTRAYVHHLFKSREMLGYRILSYHNIFFFMRLMKSIREAIESHSFNDLYNKWMV